MLHGNSIGPQAGTAHRAQPPPTAAPPLPPAAPLQPPLRHAAQEPDEMSEPTDLIGRALADLTTPLGNPLGSHGGHFVSDDAPLGSSVSAELRAKIIRNEYIVLDCLLPHLNTSALSFSAFSTNGQLDKIMVSNQKTKIKEFSTWLEAYAIYASILITAHPHEALGVLKHLDTVQRLYKQKANYIGYDIEFRKLRSVYQVPFLRYMHSLYDKAKDPLSMQSLPSVQSPTRTRMIAKLSNSTGKRYCYRYNGPQYCTTTNCSFTHRCLGCDGPHPKLKCPYTKRANADRL